MAFKTMTDYNEERYGGMFLLRNDGDSADVVFLYRSIDDVLVADVHYIKSDEYSGYVHCCGKGCPACHKNIRIQNKLFIPLYNIHDDEIQFFDRSTRFESVLMNDVFSKFPNPSEYVFRITRHGEAGSMDTRYSITAVGKNLDENMSYSAIMSKFNATFPDYYSKICRDILPADLDAMLNTRSDGGEYSSLPDYSVTPRKVINEPSDVIELPKAAIGELPEVSGADAEVSNEPDDPDNEVQF